MTPLRRQVWDFGRALPLSVVVVGALGLLRLGRQFPGAASSPALLVPFLLPVLALALEAGALVALSAAQLGLLLRLEPGTPLGRARATVPLLGLLALVLVVAEAIPRGTEHPGAFANDLVATAQNSCGNADKVAIPLLGLNVRCAEPRRIEGPMPGVRSVQVAMRTLSFSDDLRRVEISGLELTAARSLRVHLAAGQARIAGLAPWSRSPRFSPAFRFAILVALGGALWLAASLGFATPGHAPTDSHSASASASTVATGRALRLLSGLLVAVPGALVAAGFISLDQDRAAPAAYAAALVLGIAALWGLGLVARRVPKIFSSFRAF